MLKNFVRTDSPWLCVKIRRIPMWRCRDTTSWSLVFTALLVLVHWEIVYAKYPQRFWSGSNQTLQCAHCKDKTCQWKKAGSGAKQKEKG